MPSDSKPFGERVKLEPSVGAIAPHREENRARRGLCDRLDVCSGDSLRHEVLEFLAHQVGRRRPPAAALTEELEQASDLRGVATLLKGEPGTETAVAAIVDDPGGDRRTVVGPEWLHGVESERQKVPIAGVAFTERAAEVG